MQPKAKEIVFTVPSGNFGNLTAGLFAQKMGLPVHHFVAATNANDVFPQYLQSGEYSPRPSVRTLSNAMDVGNPSNFVRILDLFGSTWNIVRQHLSSYAFSDEQTKEKIRQTFGNYNYVIDPHGAVGLLAFEQYKKDNPDAVGIVLETAHYSKFMEDMETILEQELTLHPRLEALVQKEKVATILPKSFDAFKEWLMQN